MSITGNGSKILQTLKGHTSDVTTCDFAPNFTLISGSSDKTVRIWDWLPGTGYKERPTSPLRVHKYQVTCVRVSPQGSMFASASVDGTAILWNIHTSKKLFTMTQVNGDAIRVCSFAPDSSILVTAGDNGAVCIWDLIHRSLCRTLFQHEGTTQALAFTPDSQYLLTACSLEVIRIWYVQDIVDTTTNTTCNSLEKIDNAHDMGVFCVDISKQVTLDENDPLTKYYKMATSGNSNEIKIWTITSKSFSKEKQNCNEVKIEHYDTYDGHSSSVTCIKYNNSGSHLLSSSLDKLVKIWGQNGACLVTLEGHNRYVNCVAISKDSSVIVSGSTGSNDKLIIVWDVNGNITTDDELFYQDISLHNIYGTPDERHLMSDTDENNVQLLEKVDDTSEGSINCCCFYGNDVLATGSSDKLVRLYIVGEENNNIEEMCFSPLEGHTYAINHVEFSKDGHMLASCSLDGCTTLWNPMTGEKIISMPKNSLAVKVCRFSPDSNLLLTAGDDDKATLWRPENMEEVITLEGHLDAVTSAAFSPDGQIVVTGSSNSDFRIWAIDNFKCVYVQEDANDDGVTSCDFSPNLEPLPNAMTDVQIYLLASCGNDSLVKLWRISVPKQTDSTMQLENLEVKLWRSLQGHGGHISCVRFSPSVGEVVCSTAIDKQARIWSIYSGECLFVLDHDAIVTTCAFTQDCSLLVTGCFDRTLWLWKLPQQLVFQLNVASKFKTRTKPITDWNINDVTKWLKYIKMDEIVQNAQNTSLNGAKLLTLSAENICSGMDLDDEHTEKLVVEINWLKRTVNNLIEKPENVKIPHEFLCPITHEIMCQPVTCTDGYTYEKNAIQEWFMSGKYTSPMTNDRLENTDYAFNVELRNAIYAFLENIKDE